MLAHHTPLLVIADAAAVVASLAPLFVNLNIILQTISLLGSIIWLGLRLREDPAVKKVLDHFWPW